MSDPLEFLNLPCMELPRTERPITYRAAVAYAIDKLQEAVMRNDPVSMLITVGWCLGVLGDAQEDAGHYIDGSEVIR